MISSDRSLTIFINGRPYVADVEHPNWNIIQTAVKEQCWLDIPDLIDIQQAVTKYVSSSGRVTVADGTVFYDDKPIHNGLAQRIIEMMSEGFDFDALVKFLENVEENPSKRAVQELYDFLEYGKMPITSDGHFLAYKRIRGNWNDCHSNSISNKIGSVVSMPRNEVDDDSHRTCSTGLPVCSLEYLRNFWGERVVAVKVHPRDVVSVPVDYNNTKMRCCRYVVVAELDAELADRAWEQSVVDQYDDKVTPPAAMFDQECPDCGTECNVYDSYCSYCGAELD